MAKKYLKIISPCPILNTSDFNSVFGSDDGKTLKKDEKGHIRTLEFIALKNMIFEIESQRSEFIYKVKADFYPSDKIYLDSRFAKSVKSFKSSKHKHITNSKKILRNILKTEGLPYVWGGNYHKGIKKILKYYGNRKLNKEDKLSWELKGVDCSGLLFEATNGYTPRNTKELLTFGTAVLIENKSPLEIQKIIKPLDIIVFQGHVIIILDNETCFESRENNGSIKTKFLTRIDEILSSKNAKNDWETSKDFVIRRFIK